MTEITRNDALTIGTTSSEVSSNVIAAGQNARKFVLLRNSSTGGQVISVVFSNLSPAVANTGVVLAVGQHFAWSVDANLPVWQGRISAIADASGATLSVFEG